MDWNVEHAFHRNRLQYLAFVIHDKYKKSLKIPKGNQNPYIEEGQTIDIKGVIRIRISKKVRQQKPRGNQNPYIEEGQTTQWSKEKVQKDKQRSTKHTHKTKDRVTTMQLKTGGELRCSVRVSSSCSTCGTRRFNLVTCPLISNEWGKDREVFTTSETYPWSFVTQIFYNGQPKVVCWFWKNRHTFNLQLWWR